MEILESLAFCVMSEETNNYTGVIVSLSTHFADERIGAFHRTNPLLFLLYQPIDKVNNASQDNTWQE
jgi:hypothetical protein